jgi:hypothetical protein
VTIETDEPAGRTIDDGGREWREGEGARSGTARIVGREGSFGYTEAASGREQERGSNKERKEGQNIPYVDYLETLLHLRRQVSGVLVVLPREEHRLDARPEGSDELLLDSSDGGYAASERNLALHGRGWMPRR